MRNDALHGGQDAYLDVKRTLIRDQRCLCAYCEIRIARGTSDDEIDANRSNQRVEHFHPKSDPNRFPNWSLHWPNLWCVCMGGGKAPPTGEPFDADHFLPPVEENLSCDAFKSKQIEAGRMPVACEGWILAPNEVPAFPPLFKFKSNGEIHPDPANCAQWVAPVNQHSETLAARTIEHLNLNCRRLTRVRSRAWGRLEREIQRMRRLAPGATAAQVLLPLARRLLRRDPALPWAEFFSLVRSRLGIHAEQHLQEINYDG